jgi:hypothetical protein|tara:strand:- start:1374 stop:1595 length:222 start_codon:yes stop_codon:yes gene_type:complete
MDRDIRNMSTVEMWQQFIEYVSDKNQKMSDGDWCEEAFAFAGGDVKVAMSLLAMTKKAELFYKLAKSVTPAEA